MSRKESPGAASHGTRLLGNNSRLSVVIEAERQHLNAAQFLKQIIQKIAEMEAALCSITVAELVHGIYRADTPERRERRRAFLDELKAAVQVYSITDSTAEMVGKVGAESSAIGVSIPFDDLLIGPVP